MKISPMDIQRQTFTQKFRGFDRDEVRAYLGLVAEETAAMQNDRDHLARRVQELEAALNEHQERELILKNTLLTAQRVSEEIREAARRQGESVTKEAELQADRLLELAQSRANEVQRSILELRSHRTGLRMDIRAVVKRLTTLLDLQEEAEEQDNIGFLRRREGA
jgi:cell division initiation protein